MPEMATLPVRSLSHSKASLRAMNSFSLQKYSSVTGSSIEPIRKRHASRRNAGDYGKGEWADKRDTPQAALAPSRPDFLLIFARSTQKCGVFTPQNPTSTPAAAPPPCPCAFSFGTAKSCGALRRGHLTMAKCLWSNRRLLAPLISGKTKAIPYGMTFLFWWR